MKKLILMLLAAVGSVNVASAADDIYLRTEFRGTDYWSSDVDENKFTYVETNGSNEDVYTYTINASEIKTQDIWFRLHISGWGAQICPYTTNGSYTFQFSNGQNETYGAKYEKSYFQGDTYSFGISHSTIKASQYKITLFRGKNEVSYENENCRVMWIKVEIVSMPATISALGYATFSCDRALDFSNVSGLTAYKASVNNGKVVLSPVTGKVKAGNGLLIAGTSTDIPVVITDEGVNISDNLLKASLTDTEVAASTDGAYHYFLAGSDAASLGFYNLASNATSGAGKAYLETTKALSSDPATSRVAWIFADDTTTGINAIQNPQDNGILYDLQGRVAKTAKAGLYIKNGKKVLVK